MATTTERDMEDLIRTAIEHEDEGCGTESEVKGVSTFDESGMLTRNNGLVVRIKDGSEFQVTIVQSEQSDDKLDEDIGKEE
jgi:hypothetical protein